MLGVHYVGLGLNVGLEVGNPIGIVVQGPLCESEFAMLASICIYQAIA